MAMGKLKSNIKLELKTVKVPQSVLTCFKSQLDAL